MVYLTFNDSTIIQGGRVQWTDNYIDSQSFVNVDLKTLLANLIIIRVDVHRFIF